MLTIKLAIRNLARHLRRTMLLGSLIAVGMATLFIANAVFQSTNAGLESTFVRSLTGDVALSSGGDLAFSLFGSEVPIVSEYESIPPLTGFPALAERLRQLEIPETWTPVVSALAQLRVGGYTANVPVFGVDPASYFNVCPDIAIDRGNIGELAAGGVFINSKLAASVEAAISRPLAHGEDVVFGMYSGGSFRLKKGYFAGIHRYVGTNDALDRVVLADATIVRSIANYTLGYAVRNNDEQESAAATVATEDAAGTDNLFDLDDLFADAEDTTTAVDGGLTLDAVEATMADTAERDTLVLTDAAAWSFVLLRAGPGGRTALVREVRQLAASPELDLRVLSWQAAAGSSAQALFAVQSAFYVGLGFVALGAVLVIMNALVISVLERSGEIGTMRSLGAGAGFIRRLFVAESLLLTMTAAVVGVGTGMVVSGVLANVGITVSNPLLVSMFGGDSIKPLVTGGSVVYHLGLAALVGALAWVYPVALAMRIQPVTAMNGR